VLPWRKKLIAYSQPTFPTQVWAIANRGTLSETIENRRTPSQITSYIKRYNLIVLGKKDTCLDPVLYGLEKQGKLYAGSVNDIAWAVLNGQADLGLLDSPDTLIALRKWPEKLQVLGPVSETQTMGAGFRPASCQLKAEFNRFLQSIKKNGIYHRIVKKHYPDIFFYFPDAFKDMARGDMNANSGR
jgi:ABC-type amino acid transport substrate-binding protein